MKRPRPTQDYRADDDDDDDYEFIKYTTVLR
jgi:hypothetical protein